MDEILPPAITDEVSDETGQESLLSRIPHLSGGPRQAALKADYLGYRATGFPIRQACYLTGINHSTLTRWRANDSEFSDIETNHLVELQKNVGNDLVHLEFMRNMRMAMKGDFRILYKAVYHLEGLTDKEFAYLKRIRGLYSPQDLLAMGRALKPESEGPEDFAEMVIALTKTRMEVRIAKGNTDKPTEKPNVFEGESTPEQLDRLPTTTERG